MDAGPFTGTAQCLTGSYSNIFNKNPFVYSDGHDDQSFAYVMLWNHAGGGYAQVGWMKDQYSARNDFSEVNTAETHWNFSRKLYPPEPVGDYPLYQMEFSSSTNTFHFLIDGVDERDFTSVTYTGCDAFDSGETHNRDSQMPGEVSGYDNFGATEIRDSGGWHYTNNWGTLTGDANGNPVGAYLYSETGSPLSNLAIADSACP